MREEFCNLMGKIVTSKMVLVGRDFNSSELGGWEVHLGFGIRQVNGGVIRLMDWTVGKRLR